MAKKKETEVKVDIPNGEREVKTITVYEALSERKIVRDKISKIAMGHVDLTFIYDPKTEGIFRGEKVSKEKIEAEAISRFDSLNGLLERLSILSQVIDHSNATTPITVAGKVYSSKAAAMAEYGVIDKKIAIFESIKSKVTTQNQTIASSNAMKLSEDKIAEYVTKLGDDLDQNVIDSLVDQYKKLNTLELIDPKDITSKVGNILEGLYEFKDRFNTEMNKSNLETYVDIPL